MKRKLAVVLALVLLMVNVVSVIAYAIDYESEGWFDFTLVGRSGKKEDYKYSNHSITKNTNSSRGAVKLTSASPKPTSTIRTIFVNSNKTVQTSDAKWYTYGGKSVKLTFTSAYRKKDYDHFAAMRLNTDEGESPIQCVGTFTLDYIT